MFVYFTRVSWLSVRETISTKPTIAQLEGWVVNVRSAANWVRTQFAPETTCSLAPTSINVPTRIFFLF